MKVLLTHRFFWPDTAPYAVILRTIGDALAEAGHEVHVLSSLPSYRSDTRSSARKHERLGALEVRRIWVFRDEKRNSLRRLANVVLYCFALFSRILLLRPGVVTASTFPPVIAAWSACLAARLVGAKFVYHIQDIHPEISIISGGGLGRGLPMKALLWLDNQTLRRADTIITLSEDMADTLRARGLGPLPITLINNPAISSDDKPITPPSELVKSPDKIRVVFAGNHGRYQNLPLLAEGVARCFEAHPELELMFLGDGMALGELKSRWGDHPQVCFVPFLPFAEARDIISQADIGLVSLSPGIYRAAYPSKVLSYAGLGVPMLALVEPESELAKALCENGIGSVPVENTPEAVAYALEELLSRRVASNSVVEWHQTIAGSAQILARWRLLMQGMEQ
ncbi:glycosyltransferase [Sulfitobacter sp. M39]|uniref:glycosyltransferase family 4 protein n=1 Tax=Sulfitobacter sp. M39 TaxID=2675334 RepID=UPI001F42A33A|nr:glycosyltransferase family 4 protein [Sulfitobacter sp. M39]MCF7749057.1 glycosyltransferase [Sulfitobacter sp. M39]